MKIRLKEKLRNSIYSRYPKAEDVWFLINLIIGRSDAKVAPAFSGWGMTTVTTPPWQATGGGDEIAVRFREAHDQLVDLVKSGVFNLAQFSDVNVYDTLKGLMWRHYIVFWSAVNAVKSTASKSHYNFVECGVCDGLTIYFAMRALKYLKSEFTCYLYDAWEGMKKEYLLQAEKGKEGDYSYLQLASTQENLRAFYGHTVFNQGFLPDSLQTSVNPERIVWMHIDLNSALPTVAALDFFFDKMERGGVILFDDYSWPRHVEMKNRVDQWFKNKSGVLLPLPTGQGIFFKQ